MNRAQWENWIVLFLGVWLLFMPFVMIYSLPTGIEGILSLNSWIVGFALIFSAGLAIQELKPWEEWVNMVLGAWMVASPWVFGYSHQANLMWGSVIVGGAVAVLGMVSLPIAQRLQHQHHS